MNDLGNIAIVFLGIRDNVKIYHWQTKSYSRHKASDKLSNLLGDLMDKFLEVMQGSRNKRIQIGNELPIIIKNQTDTSIVTILKQFRDWLIKNDGLPSFLTKTDTELLNIRDEILAAVNQTLYLFTFE